MKIEVVCRGYYVIRVIGSLLIGAFLAVLVTSMLGFKGGNAFISFLLFWGILWYLLSRLLRNVENGEVELELLNEGLQVIWTKQFYLYQKENRLIPWSEIDQYVFQPDQYFDIFKLRLKDKRKLKWNIKETTGDFLNFYAAFRAKTEQMKASDSNITISRGRNHFETTYALVMACIISLLLLYMIETLLFEEIKGKPNYG